MPDRRTFLLTLGALAVGCAVRRRALAAAAPRAAGIQLYTVRSLLATDFAGTLQALARIGYREVEFAGYHGHSARAVRAMLVAQGLAAPSAHVGIAAFRSGWEAALDDAAVVGHRWLTLPWIPPADRTADGVRRLAAMLTTRGREAAERGMRVAYHNHDFELANGATLLDTLLAETDPAVVDFELDVYWAVRAGRDPVALLARHPGRFRLLHLKDAAGDAARTMVDVGDGTIDFAAVLAAAAAHGPLAHAFVEHDAPKDPLQSAARSHRHLAALLARTPQ